MTNRKIMENTKFVKCEDLTQSWCQVLYFGNQISQNDPQELL